MVHRYLYDVSRLIISHKKSISHCFFQNILANSLLKEPIQPTEETIELQ